MAEQATTHVMLVNSQPNFKIYNKSARPRPEDGVVTETIRLAPGANRVDATRLKDPTFIAQMKEDVELDRVYVMKGTIKDMRADAAVQLIDLTIDGDILRDWLSIENREHVRAAIETQLLAIKGIAHKAS